MSSSRRSVLRSLAAVTVLGGLPGLTATADEPAPSAPDFRQWGEDALHALHRDMWIPDRKLYAEAYRAGRQRRQPAFMWGVGVQLTALAAAAELDRETWLEPLTSYAEAIEVYWLEHDGIHGYDVLPGPKDSDRYYDDNAWVVLAMIEIHELTEDPRWLARAEETHRFVMSGEDDKLGGGLYWREKELTTKNTCTNAPAIVSALRLHQLTGEERHLEDARRIHAWTREHLQDPEDGLYLDHLRMDGSIDRRKFSYNTALMIRAERLFHEITGETSHLEEAKRLARAAAARWLRDEGGVSDGGRFAHLLLDSLLDLHPHDLEGRWLERSREVMVYVRENIRDREGRYGGRWDRPARNPWREVNILDQASPARSYWRLAAMADGASAAAADGGNE